MHQLDRSSVAAPACLADYDYRTQTWDDFGGACKSQLRFALVQLQGIHGTTTSDAAEYGVRCAYCESMIRHEGHIEHFRRKNARHHPELTFEWTNLFLACGANEHCGHFKDRPKALPYNPDQLIKPDGDDPDQYIYLHSSGEVRARHGLKSDERFRATETIRVFGLDNRVLVGARARAVAKYRKMNTDDLEEIASWDDADRQEYFQSEIEATRYIPFATTIKHFLQDAA